MTDKDLNDSNDLFSKPIQSGYVQGIRNFLQQKSTFGIPDEPISETKRMSEKPLELGNHGIVLAVEELTGPQDEDGNRADIIFDACSTIGSFDRQVREMNDLLQVLYVTGIICSNYAEYAALLALRQTAFGRQYRDGEEVCTEFSSAGKSELTREESLALTFHLVGGDAGIQLPISYADFDTAVQYHNLQMLGRAQQAIEHMEKRYG